MIWIASFPRSGNTYLRNILYEVYGQESSTFHRDDDYPLDKNYDNFPFVKTHLLPDQLEPPDPSTPSVYLVRDGRDAICSIAHHRKDIVAPGSDFYENMKAAIIAERGTFFGGWSGNAEKWIERADLIIRYEDLVRDPVGQTERIRAIADLPEADPEKLPSFQQMKFGIPQYGSGKNRGISKDEMKSLSEKNFRKGKSGSWKEEMPVEMQTLFWSYHGEMMERLGYSWDGEMKELNQDLDYTVIKKLGQKLEKRGKYNILIEGDKLISPDNDGVKRYQAGLMRALWPLNENPGSSWNIDLLIKGEIIPFKECGKLLFSSFRNKDLSKGKTETTARKSLFQRFEEKLVDIIPDSFVEYLNKKNIVFFHKTYDAVRDFFFGILGLLNRFIAFMLRILYQGKEYIKESITGNRQKMFSSYDLIHLPLMQHYKTFKKSSNAFVVTMHDLTHRYFPSYHTGINISNAEKGLKFINRNKADVIAVSKSTLEDTKRETKLPASKIHLVYEAAAKDKFYHSINADDNRKKLEKYGLSNKLPYLLCLSTIEPRKNLENTIKAFTMLMEKHPELYIHLVIAGKRGWAADKLFMHNKLLSERIIFTGFVDDEDLAALFSEATALCYASHYEGFGLPMLEAMQCMTPVIFGNNSSMPEVAGEGGLPTNPSDPEDIMKVMKKIATDKELLIELKYKALKQSVKFSWRKAALETLKVYKDVIENKE